MRKLLYVGIFTLFALFLTACGSSDSEDGEGRVDELKDNGKVNIGFANEVPYAYKDDDGELAGASVDIAKEVFAEIGIDEIDGKLASFDELIPGLGAEKFDVITAGMAITPDRCKKVSFGEPEIMYGEGLIVEKGNPLNLKSYTDIADNEDSTVVVMSGATEIGFLESAGVDPDQIDRASDIASTIAAVESGRADATTGTDMTIKEALESSGSEKLEFVHDFEQPDVEGVPSYGAAAFRQNDKELVKAYNEKLEELKDSGRVAEILEENGFSPELNSVDADITTADVCEAE